MKLIILVALVQISAFAYQVSEVSNFYISQGVLGVSTLVSFGVVVHLYRENTRLNGKIVEILTSSLKQQSEMTRALEQLNKSLDIENIIKEALGGKRGR